MNAKSPFEDEEPTLAPPLGGQQNVADESAQSTNPGDDVTLPPDPDHVISTEAASFNLSAGDFDVPSTLGRYRVSRLLGRGGFGAVYEAWDDQLQRAVAIKVTFQHMLRDDSLEQYLAEARIVASLDHPHIVPVFDVGQDEGGDYFVVSKLVDGADLAARSAGQRPERKHSLQIIAAVAEALHHAHGRGLVHRDVKPANILLDRTGQAFLTDFGIALREEEFGKGEGSTGTPSYMSPEQARGEGHRVDGRSDIYSLGVVLYELMVGRRPFVSKEIYDLLYQISETEVKPPRQIDSSVSREIERICLRALALRASDRYPTAADLADDIRHLPEFTAAKQSVVVRPESTVHSTESAEPTPTGPVRIVPRGISSFDQGDSEFFLELLPGPVDRRGLPDSIRYWKQRIEQSEDDNGFSVGVVYGPSGCGKSSLMKAGILPRLAPGVVTVYLEATGDETELRLRRGLSSKLPSLGSDRGLRELLTAVRRGQGLEDGQSLLIVIDQFEQWLHGRSDYRGEELTAALRQCDGDRVRAIVMVRDDFWMAATRLFRDLDVQITPENTQAVDLFSCDHAIKVLGLFGQAFGKLPHSRKQWSNAHQAFLQQAVEGLAEEGKVVSVRLALFAEMFKSREWSPHALAQVGGAAGIGVTFLEETFSARSAAARLRRHEPAARGLLAALLPPAGDETIKGHMQSWDSLVAASGYATQPPEFSELVRILDTELRLITPTAPQGIDEDSQRGGYYQLTHDFLVPSLRDWLTRKQRETRRGRAELLLAERAATWSAKRENRQLPSTLELMRIHALTPRSNWTPPQRTMMRRAKRVKGIFWSAALLLLVLTGVGIQRSLASVERQTAMDKTRVRIQSLQDVQGSGIPLALENLDELPRDMVVSELRSRYSDSDGQQKLNLTYGLAHFDQVETDTIVSGLLSPETDPDEVDNIVVALRRDLSGSLDKLQTAANKATGDTDWTTKARLAIAALHLGDSTLAAEMLRDQPDTKTPEVQLPNLIADFRRQIEQISDLPGDERTSPEQRMKLAVAHYFLNQDEQALAEFEALVNGGAANWEVWLRQAICQARAGRTDEAAASVEQLRKSTSTDSLVAYAEILVQAWQGDLKAASDRLDALIKDGSNDSTAQYNAACIAAQLVQVCKLKQLPGKDEFRTLALERLRNAYVKLNYNDQGSGLDNDPDFIPLFEDQEFLALLAHLKPPAITFDPIQRTVFIGEFAAWSGAVALLATQLQNTDDPALRSGICLSLASVEKPGQGAKQAWQPVLAEWYSRATDSGTHGAAGYAMAEWQLERVELNATNQPPPDRDWWHEPSGLTFVKIPSGQVTGEQGPITVTNDFWLSDSEITVGLFRQFMADEDYPGMKPNDWGGVSVFENDDGDDLPAQQVSWYDAVMFCNWLSWKLELTPCYEITTTTSPKPASADPQTQSNTPRGDDRREPFTVTWKRAADGIRLPASAEWEFACRARTTTGFSFGDDEQDLLDHGWFVVNSNSQTQSVRTKRCNAWGLFDMHGNVDEWCWDSQGSYRVFRGGSWRFTAWFCRSSHADGYVPTARSVILGFRVARGPLGLASPASE